MFCVHLAASRQTYSLIGIFLRNELERLAKACKGGIRKDLTMACKVPSRVTRSDSELHLLHNWRCLRLEKLSPRISCPIRSLVHRQITIISRLGKVVAQSNLWSSLHYNIWTLNYKCPQIHGHFGNSIFSGPG